MPDNDDIAPGSRPGADVLGLGERLRSARKARALSVEQVADALKLEVPTVLALEEGRFASLGAPVFVRGHLKRYAALVGLSVEVVLDAYRETEPGSVNPPALTRPREPDGKVNLGPWGLWVLLPVCIIAILVWVLGGSREPASGTPAATGTSSSGPASNMVVTESPAVPPGSEAAPVASDSRPATAQAPLPEPAPAPPAAPVARDEPGAGVPAPAPAAPTPAPALAPALAPAATAAATTKGTGIVLTFREDSWVNVSDADRRLLYGLQRKGSRQELRGRAPFHVMIGNARGVGVAVEGQAFTVPDTAVSDNVARFDIPAPAGAAAPARP